MKKRWDECSKKEKVARMEAIKALYSDAKAEGKRSLVARLDSQFGALLRSGGDVLEDFPDDAA